MHKARKCKNIRTKLHVLCSERIKKVAETKVTPVFTEIHLPDCFKGGGVQFSIFPFCMHVLTAKSWLLTNQVTKYTIKGSIK